MIKRDDIQMNERIFAFIVNDDQKHIEASMKQIQQLKDFNVECSQVIAFSKKGIPGFPAQLVVVPQESTINETSLRNYINAYFKQQQFKGFLHVITDHITFKDKINDYVKQLEHAMDVLDYSVHFSTVTDPCNYVYSTYNPRMEVHLDLDDYNKLELPRSLYFTSHSNTAYVTYDFSKVPDDLLKFNENFSIPMFYIIEFLARRRNTKRASQIYFMNMYLAVPLEKDAIKNDPSVIDPEPDQKVFANEDAIFKGLNIEFAPDNNIDTVLENLNNLLESKTASNQ